MKHKNSDLEILIKEHEYLIEQIMGEVKFNRLRTLEDDDDLMQQGRIALFEAAKGYNPEKGDFSHYASIAIRRNLKRYASKQDHFHIPEHQFHHTNRIVAILDKMYDLYDNVSQKMVERKFNCGKEKARCIMQLYKEAKASSANEISAYSNPVPCFTHNEKDIEDFHNREYIKYIFNTIREIYGEKYTEIIYSYFIKEMTFKQVGNTFGITQERARQIIKKIDCSEPKNYDKDRENFRLLKRKLSRI